MVLVTGAMATLGPKLLQLLHAEYKLQKDLRKRILFLSEELESIDAALGKVAAMLPDQLDEQVKIWARQVREASYNMEDILDTFLVRMEGCPKAEPTGHGMLKSAIKRMNKLLTRAKLRRDIARAIEIIKKNLEEVAERRARCKVDDIKPKAAAGWAIDPRLEAMYKEATKLVGIDGAKQELISMLSLQRGQVPNDGLKIVSVIGIGGLGKTTLAKAVYDELKSHFDCGAFVPVGRNPDFKEVFRDILIELDKHKYTDNKFLIWKERQLIDELRDFLESKRYFIVVDDVWDKKSWKSLRLALVDKNRGSRIIITTRNRYEVTNNYEFTSKNEVYNPKELSDEDSKRLFYTRIGKHPDNVVDEVSNKMLKKCGGIPLAIITMASLLVDKSMEQWLEVFNSTGFRDKDTMSILSLSYYDLPLHLRTCLLYLSAFPEDHIIDKNSLIWRWIAEGFVQMKDGIGLFEVGEGYFNDLVNRSLIQTVESKDNGVIDGCRVHDMVLDLIRSLSNEENFVTVLGIDEGTSSTSNARRLSLQEGTKNASLEENNWDTMEKLRSLTVFKYWECEGFLSFARKKKRELPFWRFKILLVLALERVHMESWDNAKNLGNLLHLRYLSFKKTTMPEVPKEVGALKFLQTLHLVDNYDIKELPWTVGQLTNLVCLHALGSIYWGTGIPNGIIKKLTSLEELLVECQPDEYEGQFKELRNLNELRVLAIKVSHMDQSMLSDLLQSLGDLQKIESLKLGHFPSGPCQSTMLDTVMLPPCLRHLLVRGHTFSRLPSCIDPTSLTRLSHLVLNVHTMDEQSMQILGGLPNLCNLVLRTNSTVTVPNIAVASCFQKLRSCDFSYSVVFFVLNEDSSVSFTLWNGEDDIYNDIVFGSRNRGECTGAQTVMPNLQELSFSVGMFSSKRKYDGIYGYLGLECLTSLQKLTVTLDYLLCDLEADTSHMTKIEAGLRQSIDVHRSQPGLTFDRINAYDEEARELTFVGINEETSQQKWTIQSVKRF